MSIQRAALLCLSYRGTPRTLARVIRNRRGPGAGRQGRKARFAATMRACRDARRQLRELLRGL